MRGIRGGLTFAACALVVAVLGGGIVSGAGATTRAFTGVRLFDGTGRVVDNATLVVRDGRIVAAGTGVAVPNDAERVDLAGRFVMPGLVSAHGHVGATRGSALGSGALQPRERARSAAALRPLRRHHRRQPRRRPRGGLPRARRAGRGRRSTARGSTSRARSWTRRRRRRRGRRWRRSPREAGLGEDPRRRHARHDAEDAARRLPGRDRRGAQARPARGRPPLLSGGRAGPAGVPGVDFIAHSVRDAPVDAGVRRLLLARRASASARR